MKLTLEQSNIEDAVRTYLQNTYGLSLRNKQTVMDFKAGRGTNGLSVLISIEDATIPGGAEQVNQSGLVGAQLAPKVSAADKIAASVSTSPEGTLGALINANQTPDVTPAAVETPVPVADLPSTMTAETPIVVEGQVPPQETAVTADPAVTPAEPEVPAVTTEAAVQEAEQAPVTEAAPAKTTSGLFS